jgi:hypothetical protein
MPSQSAITVRSAAVLEQLHIRTVTQRMEDYTLACWAK